MGRDCVHKSFDLNIHARKLQKPPRALKTIFSSVEYKPLAQFFITVAAVMC